MSQEELKKAERLWQSMNDATGKNQPFPAELVAVVLNEESSKLEQYDRNASIPQI